MLCQECKQREAIRHINICSSGSGDDVSKTVDLCGECFKTFNPAIARELAAAFEAGCKYCGGKPEIGGGDPLSTLNGIRKTRFLCESCSVEYFRFINRKLPGFGSAEVTEELKSKIQGTDVQALFTGLEEHMKKWVSGKDSQ